MTVQKTPGRYQPPQKPDELAPHDRPHWGKLHRGRGTHHAWYAWDGIGAYAWCGVSYGKPAGEPANQLTTITGDGPVCEECRAAINAARAAYDDNHRQDG